MAALRNAKKRQDSTVKVSNCNSLHTFTLTHMQRTGFDHIFMSQDYHSTYIPLNFISTILLCWLSSWHAFQTFDKCQCILSNENELIFMKSLVLWIWQRNLQKSSLNRYVFVIVAIF